jgi:hypothetical protein
MCKKKVDVQITASYTPYPMERSSVAPVHIIMNLLARDATTAKTFSGIYATFWTIKAFLIGLYTMKTILQNFSNHIIHAIKSMQKHILMCVIDNEVVKDKCQNPF